MIQTAKPGDFALVYHDANGIPRPVLLTAEYHKVLQGLLAMVPVYILENKVVTYENELTAPEETTF